MGKTSVRKERLTQISEKNIVGSNIRRLRKECGLKATEVIAKLQCVGIEVNTGTFSKIENARNNPTVEMIIELSKIFNCDFNEFFKEL